MYISLNWLKEFVGFEYPPKELDNILTMLGIEVEVVTDFGKKYNNFYTAEVLKKEKHPNADKLSLCVVFDGESKKNVVCGAANVSQGQKVVFGRIGAVVPQSNITLEKREIRGFESNGMICSQFELELSEEKSGIWVLPNDTPVGIRLSEYIDSDDTIFEISVTPNRADCLSHLGIAREIAAYSNQTVKIPHFEIKENDNSINNSIEIVIEDTEKCPRYTARVIKNIVVKESPQWLKSRLIKLGQRPVNNIVDITNLVLLECGQPLHAFDLDTIKGNKIVVKTFEDNYEFTTLDGKLRKLDNNMLMICDETRPIAIGGVMGGENTEISNKTKNIIIESAYFKPTSIRKTSKKLGIQSEASYRFERGVDIDNIVYALNRATQLISELTEAPAEKGVIDVYPVEKIKPVVSVRYQKALDIIGFDFTTEKVKQIFKALQFKQVKEDEESITVEIPNYRIDINDEIDLIEEIARLINYDNIEPSFFSNIDFEKKEVNEALAQPALRQKISDFFVHNGFNEMLSQNMLDKSSSKLFTGDLIEIANPLGEELSIMRPSLLPAMLKAIERNFRIGKSNLRLFEIGTTFHKVDENVNTFITGILEKEELIVAITGKYLPKQWAEKDRNVDFYDIKGIFENLISYLKINGITTLQNQNDIAFSSDSLAINYDSKKIGSVGEIRKSITKIYNIEVPVFVIYLDLSVIYKIERPKIKYTPISPYPSMNRDIGFVIDITVNAEDIRQDILNNGGKLLKSVEVFDVYSGKSIEEGKKNIAFNLTFSSNERTLTDKEVEDAISNVTNSVEKRFNAVLRKF